MSGGKLYPLFAEVRRHAEEGRANVLVSLELLRREVEEMRLERDRERVQFSEDELRWIKTVLADRRVLEVPQGKPTNGRKNRKTRKRKKPAARKR